MIKIKDSYIEEIKRYPDNTKVLFNPLKITESATEAMCLHGLCLEGAEYCTCPARAFVIFLSMEPVDIESDYFNHFNDITTS